MEEFYQLKPRTIWGDYGQTLIQVTWNCCRLKTGQVSNRLSLVCVPFEAVTLPSGLLTCSAHVKECLEKKFNSLDFIKCIPGRIVNVNWRPWLQRESPIYPQSGEPEDYLSENERVELEEDRWFVRSSLICNLVVPSMEDMIAQVRYQKPLPIRFVSEPVSADFFYCSYGERKPICAALATRKFCEALSGFGNAIDFESIAPASMIIFP